MRAGVRKDETIHNITRRGFTGKAGLAGLAAGAVRCGKFKNVPKIAS